MPFFLSSIPQRDPLWHELREGRMTMSRIGRKDGWLGGGNPADLQRGIDAEPIVRGWYERKYSVEVEEVGIAIPHWDERLGASVDGLVGKDGMIEIKSRRALSHMLRYRADLVIKGLQQDGNWEHIPLSDYWQMQGCMAITERKWCDYLVMSGDEIYNERIVFDKKYWVETIYPSAKKEMESWPVPKIGLAEARLWGGKDY